MVGKSCFATLGSANSFGIRVGALTSKGRSVCLLQRHRGWMLHIAFSYKAKILHTSARFPLSQHREFYFPPSATQTVPLSFQNGKRVAFFPLISFRMLTFNKVEEVQHIIVIPSTSHSGINYPPPALGWRSTLSLQKGAAYCKLPFCQLLHS